MTFPEQNDVTISQPEAVEVPLALLDIQTAASYIEPVDKVTAVVDEIQDDREKQLQQIDNVPQYLPPEPEATTVSDDDDTSFYETRSVVEEAAVEQKEEAPSEEESAAFEEPTATLEEPSLAPHVPYSEEEVLPIELKDEVIAAQDITQEELCSETGQQTVEVTALSTEEEDAASKAATFTIGDYEEQESKGSSTSNEYYACLALSMSSLPTQGH